MKDLNNKKIFNMEYNTFNDSIVITKEFKKAKIVTKIKAFIFILLFLFYEGLTYVFKNNIKILKVDLAPFVYLIICTFILSVALICSISLNKTFKNLISNVLIISFSGLISYIQILHLVFFETNLNNEINLFIGIILLFLIINSLNKILSIKKVLKNLKFISSSNEKYSAKTFQKDMLSDDTLKNIDTLNPICINRIKVKKLINFIKNSTQKERSEKHTMILAIFLISLAIIVSVLNFITNKNLPAALDECIAITLFAYPVSLILSLKTSLYNTCKKALRKGALITNTYTIEKFKNINLSIIDASSLYPSKNVILKEIKTFKGQRVDEAILYAATLASTKDGTLNKVFNRIILGQKKLLEKASNVIYEDKLGITGWINGKKIIIGNRDILKKNSIDPPSRDYENKYTKQNEGLIYIAVGNELVAMFILEYKPNKKLKKTLAKAIKSGIEILIRTSDTNITKERIAIDFGLTKNLIKILPYDENIYSKEIETFKETDESDLAVMPGQESLLNAAILCKKTAMNFKLIYAIQVTYLLMSLLILTVLILCNSIYQIQEIQALIYISFWSAFSLICAKFK